MEVSKLNMRTHPVVQNTTTTNTVNLGITTRCSMKCPNCSVNVPAILKAKEAKDACLTSIARAAYYLRPLRRVHITGGEPTLHEKFRYIANKARNLFGSQYVTIETNGAKVEQYVDLFIDKSVFDLVFITHYVKDAIYPGSPDNTAVIERMQSLIGDRLVVEPPVTHMDAHTTIQTELRVREVEYKGPIEVPCSKFWDPGLPAGWYNGKLYKCCVSFGIDASLGIEVDNDWKENIMKASMGCNFCCYRGT